jgi:hypothetical protein
MTSLQGGINKNSPTSELEIIKEKRAALQQLVKLTCTLNRLHQGLQAVILMGKSASQIPARIIQKFKSLSDSLKGRPTETLKNTLLSTDQKIQRDIKHVLEISQKSDELLEKQLGGHGKKLIDTLKEDYHEYVNDFKKKSQTSITLRITLKSRKTRIQAFNLPVPESFIEQQIVTLNHREETCRKTIKNDMTTLQSDIQSLMERDDCSEEIKNILTEIDSDLKNNATHFNSNKNIEDMPMIYESIELSGAQQVIDEVQDEQEQPAETMEDNSEPEQATKITKKKRGFLNKLGIWLTTSKGKKWEDID